MDIIKEYIDYIKDKKRLSENTSIILFYRYKKIYSDYLDNKNIKLKK